MLLPEHPASRTKVEDPFESGGTKEHHEHDDTSHRLASEEETR